MQTAIDFRIEDLLNPTHKHIQTHTATSEKPKKKKKNRMKRYAASFNQLSVSDLVTDYSLFMIASVHLNVLDNFSFDMSEPLSKWRISNTSLVSFDFIYGVG